MSMFNDISRGSKDNEKECLANAKLVSLYARRFGKGHWSFIGPGSKKKWYCINEDSPQEVWDNMAERMLLEFAESGYPIFRATSPLSRGRLKSKGGGKLSIHYAADLETIETIFRIIVSANQLNLYGAVAEICEEYESLHERTESPVVMGHSSSSLVLSVIKTEVPLDCDDPVNVVEIGQYFRTKDTAEFSQFHAVACRECTLPREEEASQPKGWNQGNTKIGPVLEVATSYLHGKCGVEVRILSLNRYNTHSWVRISHGSNRFVMNLNNNETEIPEVQLEEYAIKLDAKDFACRSKAKAKPQRRELAGSSPRTVPIGKRTWTDVEPGECSFSDFEVSKKVMLLLRHSQHVHREEDGAVHFWRIKENLQNQFPHSPHWSDGEWKVCLAGGGGDKRKFQYCNDASGTIIYFRALLGHSGRNIIDPSLQDNVIIQSNFFQYIYHVGCTFNLHSIINNGLIPGGQNSSKRQTVFFLPIDPRNKDHQDLATIDFNKPRRAKYLHSAWKKHQDAVFWVGVDLVIRGD